MDMFTSENGDSHIVAIVATSTFAICVAYYIWGALSGGKKTNKSANKNVEKANKKPVPLTLEGQIENVSLRYENEFKPRIEKLLDSFDKEDEKQIYERNYCNEMLLKLLIELDGVDLIALEPERKQILKQKRKDVIKVIQSELKALDALH